MNWSFQTNAMWSARVGAVPRGDRSADWYDQAVPEVARTMAGTATIPSAVVVRITSTAPLGIRGKAKRLLDALHDQRGTGAKYASLPSAPPLEDDDPAHVSALAVEVRRGLDQIDYSMGPDLVANWQPLGSVHVSTNCPNDIGAGRAENDRIREGRQAFGRDLAGAWRIEELEIPPTSECAVVMRHPVGRDEDNTWEGWLGALCGATWNEAWPGAPPLQIKQLVSIASVADREIESGVRYELYSTPA